MRRKPVFRWLAVIAVATVAALVVVFTRSDASQRAELRLEFGKGLIQLLVVAGFGAALQLLIDRYQDQQQRAEQNRQFRQDKYDRLVQATNQLRRASILIDANRSVKTWSEQMLAVIDAGLTLRMIKHQIYSSRDLNDPPFQNHTALVHLFELMYRYTDWVTADFADHKKALSESQRQAEDKDLTDEERSQRQDAIWEKIQELPSVADMRKLVPDEERESRRALIMQEVQAVEKNSAIRNSLPATTPSWVGYEEAETLALESITRTTLMKASGRETAFSWFRPRTRQSQRRQPEGQK